MADRGEFLCDTAQSLVGGVDDTTWTIVQLNSFLSQSNEVKRALTDNESLRHQFGGGKKIIVPKSMIVGNREDDLRRLLLVTSLDHEKYDATDVADKLGYVSSRGISHQGIDTQTVMGRIPGECSVVVASSALSRFTFVDFSDTLRLALNRSNALAVYPLGGQAFFCMDGKTFTGQFRQVLNQQGLRSNL